MLEACSCLKGRLPPPSCVVNSLQNPANPADPCQPL